MASRPLVLVGVSYWFLDRAEFGTVVYLRLARFYRSPVEMAGLAGHWGFVAGLWVEVVELFKFLR